MIGHILLMIFLSGLIFINQKRQTSSLKELEAMRPHIKDTQLLEKTEKDIKQGRTRLKIWKLFYLIPLASAIWVIWANYFL